MNDNLKKELKHVADTVRILSIEAVQKANSGHPGLPMGCAEIGAYLFGHYMNFNPKNPLWLNRDRLVLSAGHGSMWLYSLLHMSGYDLSLEEIKNFRQLKSKTPGHPEIGITSGVEATTGPLGQGVANAVGMALGCRLLRRKFSSEEFVLFNNKVICLAGDGCLMEGISSEASSFAGHICLDNFILIHDANRICLDGELAECCSEDTKERYKSYGFDVYELDGYDFEAMDELFSKFRLDQKRPVFIEMHTVIGQGSPNKAGSHKAHGSPLGEEEVALVKKNYNMTEAPFFVSKEVSNFFAIRAKKLAEKEQAWNETLRAWGNAHKELFQEFEKMKKHHIPDDLEDKLKKLEIKTPISGRKAAQASINLIAKELPQIYGGSADLSGSDCTMLKEYAIVAPNNFIGRNMKYGVREFAMAAISSGLSTTELIRPFCGTFLTFSDYMRNAIRLAALSHYKVVYQFTHDSIFLGEDGPTHQPIEHYMTLRAIPHLHVIRPGSAYEAKMAWFAALKHNGPTALIFTRQNLVEVESTHVPYSEGMARGAYIINKEKNAKIDFVIMATGSELPLAHDLTKKLEQMQKSVRLISFPCWELFEKQPLEYKNSLLKTDAKKISIEAGIAQGWWKYIGHDGIPISIEEFGHSAPIDSLVDFFKFNVDAILERII